MEPVRGVKGFATRPLGRVVLIVVAIATLAASFLFLGPFLAIPAFLLFGLALPIYMGWKRPRQLAMVGLIVLLACGPITSVVETSLIRTPAPPSQSLYGVGGAVLQNASVQPYTGAAGALYHWSVDLRPQHVPKGESGILNITLVVTNCPGTLAAGSSSCPSGYLFIRTNHTFPGGTMTPQRVLMNATLPGSAIWYWQMVGAVHNLTSPSNVTLFFLDAGGYVTIEGPVSGDFLSTFGLIIPGFYEALFLYAGVVFYVALLFYVIFKVREQRRKAARALPPVPTEPVASGATPERPAPAPALPSTQELNCPNCQAVVYPNEVRCWKCGVALPGRQGQAQRGASKP